MSAAALTSPALARAAVQPSDRFRSWLGQRWEVEPRQRVVMALADLRLRLDQALDGIAEWVIPASARLTLLLPPGTTELSAPISIDHPHGKNLEIRGAAGGAEPTTLVWAGTGDAFYVGNGCSLGLIDRLRMIHATPSRRGRGSAILADEGGYAHCGEGVVVDGFYYGFTARRGGILRAAGTRCDNAGDAGYFAFMGGHISAQGAVARSAADPDLPLGSGFVAEYGGSIDAEDSASYNNKLAGYVALSGGSLRAYGCRASGNSKAAFVVGSGGSITAHRAIATRDCGVHVLNFGGGHFFGNQVMQMAGSCR